MDFITLININTLIDQPLVRGLISDNKYEVCKLRVMRLATLRPIWQHWKCWFEVAEGKHVIRLKASVPVRA